MKEIILRHLGKVHRKTYYGNDTFNHPAKMHPELARWIILNYSKKGDVVLDPMAGIGTSLIEARLLGRKPYGIEIEEKWCKLIIDSPANNIKGIIPMHKIQVICGDATKVRSFLSIPTDLVVTSPPYGIIMKGRGIADEQRPGGMTPYEEDNEKNIGNYLLNDERYHESMKKIYTNCYDKTEENGYMVTVTKNFYSRGEIQRLDLVTEELMVSSGWTCVDKIKFRLPYISMWQKMYAKKYPEREVFYHEDVLVFRKLHLNEE
jgi:DNA modification methylase